MLLAGHHADGDVTKRHRLVNVRMEGEDAATEDEDHAAEERNRRSEEPGGGNGGASHGSIALQFAIRNGVSAESVPGKTKNGRGRPPYAGIVNENVLPIPGVLSTVIRPPCASTASLQKARPRP